MTGIRARAGSDDDGSVLVLALIFITVIGVLVTALLTSTHVGLRTAVVVDDGRQVSYAADGGVEALINAIRKDKEAGRDPATDPSIDPANCPDFIVPDTNGESMRVVCTPHAESGQVTDPGSSGGGTAVRVLGNHPGVEDSFKKTSNGTLAISGAVEVNGNITTESADARIDVTNGGVDAVRTCDKTRITASDGVRCAPDDTVTAFPDPGTAMQTVDFTARTVPTCSSSAVGQTPLLPGMYTDAVALSALTSCGKSIVHFTPGVYYFDFPSSAPIWTMTSNSTHVVGGTGTTAWTPTAPPASSLPLLNVPMCDKTKPGVQFVFGGTSRLAIRDGYMELCPINGADPAKSVVVYGAKPSAATSPVDRSVLATSASASGGFVNPNNALTINTSSSATADINNSTASVTLSGFNGAVPADATIETVVMRVAHSEAGTPNGSNPTLTATISGPGFSCPASTVPESSSYVILSVDVKTCLSSPTRLNGFTVSFSMTIGHPKSAKTALDGIDVQVRYQPAGVKAQAGCVITLGYQGLDTPAGSCALLTTSGSQTGLVLRGGIYAPSAALDIALPGGSIQRFENGFVSRHLRLQINPSTSYVGRVLDITTGAARPPVRKNRTVDLVAYDSTGEPRLKATVEFEDANGLDPGREVRVLKWDVLRG